MVKALPATGELRISPPVLNVAPGTTGTVTLTAKNAAGGAVPNLPVRSNNLLTFSEGPPVIIASAVDREFLSCYVSLSTGAALCHFIAPYSYI